MANPNGRQMRLECIKIAANIVIQLKDPKISVVGLSRQFMAFIDATDTVDDDTAVSDTEWGNGHTKQVRKSFVALSRDSAVER